MVYFSKDGKAIITAGEVGSFTVCPEAWRLTAVKRRRPLVESSVTQGQAKHEEWVEGCDESLYLARSARLIVLLLLIALGAFLLLAEIGPLWL